MSISTCLVDVVWTGVGGEWTDIFYRIYSGKSSRVNFSRTGYFEHFRILIFEDSPGKWSHIHKLAMCLCIARAHAR